GTGEASGDGRAVMAAEAAIANPLLDETSMKGARGLLISITGGNDLTLYEVDEAASRIRQEVDEEANIILGATFDDALDGIIRVSVVATGIDSIGELQQPAPVRIADIMPRPRAITAPVAKPVQTPVAAAAPEPQPQAKVEEPAEAAVSEEETNVEVYQPQQQHAETEPAVAQTAPAPQPAPVSQPAPAAPAPLAAQPQFYQQPAQQAYQQAPAYEQAEPVAEVVRPVPMPRVEDLPLPVQEQLRAQRDDAPAHPSGPEQKRRSLLERLASFGVNRDAEPEPVRQQPQMSHSGPMVQPPRAPAAAPVQHRPAPPPAAAVQATIQPVPQPQMQSYAPPPAAAQPAPAQPNLGQPNLGQPSLGQPSLGQPSPAHAAYGKRPAPQASRPQAQPQLDLHGRPQGQLRPIEDEQLEIPAFLRRQTG
ncbi:MAG: hypothetical protein KDJ29_07830, partial [Hyphomicrobiales bacterium]|nr:hypothetical protein [Hyphomicrobiales bacterium]